MASTPPPRLPRPVRRRARGLPRLLAGLVLAAAALHCAAQYRIGAEALERGDYAEAWLILKPMADAGDARAQNDIAIMHAFGLGVPASMEDAARWLARAAAQGNVASQARLGWMYYRGVGVEVDLERAAHWSRLAAEQGDAWAQSNYGFLLDRGEGVAQDLTAAARWYRRSAEQGFPEAQRNLGNLYEYGQGVERDLVEAYAWYGVAAAGGDGPARVMRDSVETRLAPQRLRAAQARARELFQRHGSDPSLGG